MTTSDTEAEIVRLHFAEHWKVGTIAAQLGVHPDVVRRILGIGVPRSPGTVHGASGRPVSRLHCQHTGQLSRTVLDTTSRYALPARFPWFGPHPARVMWPPCGRSGTARSFFTPSRSVASRPRSIGLHRQTACARRPNAPSGSLSSYSATPAPCGASLSSNLSVYSLCRSLVRAAKALGGVTRQWLFGQSQNGCPLSASATPRGFHPHAPFTVR